jgi:hypothetical protein
MQRNACLFLFPFHNPLPLHEEVLPLSPSPHPHITLNNLWVQPCLENVNIQCSGRCFPSCCSNLLCPILRELPEVSQTHDFSLAGNEDFPLAGSASWSAQHSNSNRAIERCWTLEPGSLGSEFSIQVQWSWCDLGWLLNLIELSLEKL